MQFTYQFLKNCTDFIREKALLSPGDHVWVAVSGGIDSIVLLDVLLQIREDWQLTLGVLHLNHGIRGTESDADEAFVRRLAHAHGLKLHSEKRDVPRFARRHQLGLEEAARKQRYAFFETILAHSDFNKVALGHQKNDQAETILENLLRGAGLTGLRGIPVRWGPFVWPLLWANRSDIRRYAKARGLKFRDDSSNVDVRFRRNRLRHELLPYLEKHFNPEIVKSLNQLGEVAAETENFLVAEAERTVRDCILARETTKIILDIHKFSDYFNSVQKYIFKHLLLQMGAKQSDLTFGKYRALLDLVQNRQKGKRVVISADLDVLLDHAGLVIEKRQTKSPISYTARIGESIFLPELGVLFQIKRSPKIEKSDLFQQDSSQEWVDFSKLEGKTLHIRTWRAGDRFIPLGMKNFKKVSDFLTDEKVPLHSRGRVLVLTADGHIVWLVGFRLDDRFKVTRKTKEMIHLKIQKMQENP